MLVPIQQNAGLPNDISKNPVVEESIQININENSDDSDTDDTRDPEVKYNLTSNEQAEELVSLEIDRTVATQKYCIICGGNTTSNLILIPEKARCQSYAKRKLFIPIGDRCCRSHIIFDSFFEEDLMKIKVYSNISEITSKELSCMMENLAISCDKSLFDQVSDFSMPETQLRLFTSLTWENLLQLKEMLTSLRNSCNRTTTQAIVTFLFKLKTGNSHELIASILHLPNKGVVSEYLKSVRCAFVQDILAKHFGCQNTTREKIIYETSPIARTVLKADNEDLILICDGTYARHQKSTNNEYQRRSFSGQKKVPLCKPFTICTTSGFIVDMLGPFGTNENDARILRTILEVENTGLSDLLEARDIFVLDRGFRDIIEYLNSKGYKTAMPALKGKRKQLESLEANRSRLITKVRWVVEAVHGILKQKYQLLDRKIDNKIVPTIGEYFRIAAFLQNQFGQRLTSDKDAGEEIIARMQALVDTPNYLAEEVETGKWARKKVIFRRITSNAIKDFPQLTEAQLILLFTGTYQLGQAKSYLAEITNEDGSLNVDYLKENATILRIQSRSRHSNRKTYTSFIDYTLKRNDVAGICRYCCDCANGKRTVGCCSHVAAIIYYLSHARYLARIINPAEILTNMFKNTAFVGVQEDSDTDEDADVTTLPD
ncbi:uncharacterized protein [Euwallacea similis]|uniref:uncharacterized protein n=1 Tax=Euwallacea similis TaxID=1736056 RepID=UPI003450FC2D